MFKRLLFLIFVSAACFCHADVVLRTSSGQEVYLTDSQFKLFSDMLLSIFGNVNQIMDTTDEQYEYLDGALSFIQDMLVYVQSNTKETEDILYSFLVSNPNNSNPAYYNLSFYSNIYSNQISRFLSAYTNNLAHQFAVLPTQNWLYPYLQDISQSLVYNRENYFTWYDMHEPNYAYDTAWERLINLQRNQQFQYVYNSNYNPLYNEVQQGFPYDLQALRNLCAEEGNLLRHYKHIGYERDNPLLFSNQLIKVNALYKLLEDKQAAFLNKYKSSLIQADNWKNGYVDFQGDFISWDSPWVGGMPQVVSDLIAFNAFDMPLNDAFEFATNYLSRLANPNDDVFGSLDKETKEFYESEIQKQVSTLADVKTQEQLDNFVNGLQQMLNTMSNCCQNMSYLPYIADMVSNLVQNVGNDRPGGGSGDGTNDNSDVEIPLGFAPSETNKVDYFINWQNTPFSFTPVTFEKTKVQSAESQQRYESERHNQQFNDLQTNAFKRVVPVISRFGSYAETLKRDSPPESIEIIDVEPIQQFARYTAHVDIDFSGGSQVMRTKANSNRPGTMDLAWSYYKILAPLHAFFNVFWLLVGAFLLFMSWVWLFRGVMRFRKFLLDLWWMIQQLFK